MDLTTRYLGLTLKNPLVASASPLTGDLGNLRRLEDCGAAAVVLPSIFEEEIEAEAAESERLTIARGESFAEALSYFPAAIGYGIRPHAYLDLIRRAREALAIPVIASLNGISPAGWRDYARLVEEGVPVPSSSTPISSPPNSRSAAVRSKVSISRRSNR